MFDKAKADKKLGSLINVTVSHDMRNPLNALHSQSLQQTFLNEKINDLIGDYESQSKDQVISKLKLIQRSHLESVDIIKSSTHI